MPTQDQVDSVTEVRRYEIAKVIFPVLLERMPYSPPNRLATEAILLADALLKELG